MSDAGGARAGRPQPWHLWLAGCVAAIAFAFAIYATKLVRTSFDMEQTWQRREFKVAEVTNAHRARGGMWYVTVNVRYVEASGLSRLIKPRYAIPIGQSDPAFPIRSGSSVELLVSPSDPLELVPPEQLINRFGRAYMLVFSWSAAFLAFGYWVRLRCKAAQAKSRPA